MEKNTDTTEIDKRIAEIEAKASYFKLKRYEKKELKSLRGKKAEFQSKIKQEIERKKKEEEEKRKKEEEKKRKDEEKRRKEAEEKRRKLEEEYRIKEYEERQRKKKEIIKRQKRFQAKEIKQENVKEVLEDMCVLGSIMKEEIIEEKKKNPEKFIPIEEAVKEENKNSGNFCLGILAQNLENIGITTAIERNESNDAESQDASNTVLQFVMNGMIEKKKYDLHFDLGADRNYELLSNPSEQKKFNDKLRKKLSLEYNIPEEKIIITNPQKGSYSIQVIFESNDFNNQSIDINMLKKNCNDKEFEELKKLKEIHTSLVMEGCKLSSGMLDSRGNRESGWGENEKRGGFDYFPPKGWKGFGLKVWDKYDNGNNDWLAYNGNSNEWAVAYHGLAARGNCKVEDAVNNIYNTKFMIGKAQACKDHKNINTRYKFNPNEDTEDHTNKVGVGVYCSPNPEVMETYANQAVDDSKAKINGKRYLMGFMMRVKPDKIRISSSVPDYWVLDGTTDQMRPYRIMVKEN